MTPDPGAWHRHETLPDGTRVLVRPLAPDDAALYPDFSHAVTPEDARLRFLTPIRELSAERIFELTHFDPRRAMAFIAIEEATGKMLGVVRLHLDDDRTDGEYAVTVRSELKGHGLGWLLMQLIIEYARTIGLARIHGLVLAENTMMLQMSAELGFRIRNEGGSMHIKRVTLDLTP